MANIEPGTNLKTVCEGFDLGDFDIDDTIKKLSLNLDELTTNVKVHAEGEFGPRDWIVTGDGMLDKLMETVTKHLKAQFEANRIREEDYANSYTEILKTVFQTTIDAWLKKAAIESEVENRWLNTQLLQAQMKLIPYQAKKLAAETEHICETTVHERIKERNTESNTLLVDANTAHVKETTEHEKLKEDLTESQTCLTSKQCEHEANKIKFTDAQTEQVKETTIHEKDKEKLTQAQTCLTQKQCDHESNKIKLTDAQTENVKETTIHEKLKENLTKAQTCIAEKQCEHETIKILHTETDTEKLKTEISKLAAEASIIPYQIKKLVADTCLVNAEIPLTNEKVNLTKEQTNNTTADTAVKGKQLDVMDAGINETNKKADNIEAQTTQVIPAEVEQKKQQTTNLKAEKLHIDAQTKLTTKQVELGTAQIAKTNSEKLYTDAQRANVLETTKLILPADEDLKRAQAEKLRREDQLLEKQIELAIENVKLIGEQIKLQQAQVTESEAKGALYKRQIEGYDEDYISKILKIMLDSWGVGFSVAKDNFDSGAIPAAMQAGSITEIYNKYVVPNLDNYKYIRSFVTNTQTTTKSEDK